MLNRIQQLSQLLKKAGYTVFQDVATGTDYPYCVYSFVSDTPHRASNKVITHTREYQLSLFSEDDASCLDELTAVLDAAGVIYEPFVSQAGAENDMTVTNYYTYIHFDTGGDSDGD